MRRETHEELHELIERGQRSIADIQKFLADSERRKTARRPVQGQKSSRPVAERMNKGKHGIV